MNFYWNKKDKELVVTWFENDEQLQVVIEPYSAVWTGYDSDKQFNEYPQWCFALKEWLENKLKEVKK